MQRGVLQALNPLFNRMTFTAIVPQAYPGRPKCAKNVLKWRTFKLTGWITGKRLKIDGFMLRCIWQASNSLSIHVTFTAIVPGAYQGRPKCAKNVLKWRTFKLTGWITGKLLKIDGCMLRCVWQALNSLYIHVTCTAIVPGAYTGRPKMCLRLFWRSQMHPKIGWRQRHTGVTLVR